MDSRARHVVHMGDKLFSDKGPVDSLWQEIALNFYPERAEFTEKRNQGEEFSDHLFSSYPVQARRELGNMLDEFLFPENWFSIHVDDDELDEGDEERAFLEKLTDVQRRAMNDPDAQLVVARGQVNHDFAAFGNGVLRFGKNRMGDTLLFRNYHLRDCAWSENAEGVVDILHRNWNPTARQLMAHFPKSVSEHVRKAMGDGSGKDPDKTFRCRHVVLPSRVYDYQTKGGKRFPYCSLFVECESETVLEEVGVNRFEYVVPRWQTVSSSAYATSMVTAVILPDGRTMQVMMRTLREAGENYVNPPMLAFMDAIRGDIAMYPGGITTSDIEYDGKLADVLRPITKDKGGFPIGMELAAAIKEDIRAGSLLDKIQLPETSHDMTATEVRRRIKEHIRAAGPISKPIQPRYQNALCSGVFDLLKEEKVFPMQWMPRSLMGRGIKFKFRSPLDELAEENEAATFVEVRDTIIAPSAAIDPEVWDEFDLKRATRDAARSAGFKQKWMHPREVVEQQRAQRQEEIDAQETVGDIATAGALAEQGGRGIEALVSAAQQAGMGQPGGGGTGMEIPGIGGAGPGYAPTGISGGIPGLTPGAGADPMAALMGAAAAPGGPAMAPAPAARAPQRAGAAARRPAARPGARPAPRANGRAGAPAY